MQIFRNIPQSVKTLLPLPLPPTPSLQPMDISKAGQSGAFASSLAPPFQSMMMQPFQTMQQLQQAQAQHHAAMMSHQGDQTMYLQGLQAPQTILSTSMTMPMPLQGQDFKATSTQPVGQESAHHASMAAPMPMGVMPTDGSQQHSHAGSISMLPSPSAALGASLAMTMPQQQLAQQQQQQQFMGVGGLQQSLASLTGGCSEFVDLFYY